MPAIVSGLRNSDSGIPWIQVNVFPGSLLIFSYFIASRTGRDDFLKGAPIPSAAEKTEETSRMRAAPFQDRVATQTTLVENAHHTGVINPVFFERKRGDDVGLGADVTGAVFVRTNANIADHLLFPDEFLKRLSLSIFVHQRICGDGASRQKP